MKTAHLLSGMKKKTTTTTNKQCIFLYGRPVKTDQSAHPHSLISLHCSREEASTRVLGTHRTPSDPGWRVIRGCTSFCVGLADVKVSENHVWSLNSVTRMLFSYTKKKKKMQRKGMLPATVLKMPLPGQMITSFWRHEVVCVCACYWWRQILWRPRNAKKYVKLQSRVLTVLEFT